MARSRGRSWGQVWACANAAARRPAGKFGSAARAARTSARELAPGQPLDQEGGLEVFGQWAGIPDRHSCTGIERVRRDHPDPLAIGVEGQSSHFRRLVGSQEQFLPGAGIPELPLAATEIPRSDQGCEPTTIRAERQTDRSGQDAAEPPSRRLRLAQIPDKDLAWDHGRAVVARDAGGQPGAVGREGQGLEVDGVPF